MQTCYSALVGDSLPMKDPAQIYLNQLLDEVINIMSKNIETPRTEELRNFINKHQDVPEFKELAITLILIAEGG